MISEILKVIGWDGVLLRSGNGIVSTFKNSRMVVSGSRSIEAVCCCTKLRGLSLESSLFIQQRLRLSFLRFFPVKTATGFPLPSGNGDVVSWELVGSLSKEVRPLAGLVELGGHFLRQHVAAFQKAICIPETTHP